MELPKHACQNCICWFCDSFLDGAAFKLNLLIVRSQYLLNAEIFQKYLLNRESESHIRFRFQYPVLNSASILIQELWLYPSTWEPLLMESSLLKLKNITLIFLVDIKIDKISPRIRFPLFLNILHRLMLRLNAGLWVK
jgi:hypothetical protein